MFHCRCGRITKPKEPTALIEFKRTWRDSSGKLHEDIFHQKQICKDCVKKRG